MASAYASICHQHMPAYRGTLGICHVRFKYADIRQCSLLHAEAKLYFWRCSLNFQRMRAYSIDITHALTIDIR